jgi:hypothetical protein
MWAETYYCVGIPGTPTAPVTSITVTPTQTGTPKPSPTQDGLISTCQKFYFAGKKLATQTSDRKYPLIFPLRLVKDDTCAKVVKKYGTFTLKEFITWNPAVGEDCSSIWAET